jgi:hypothetical protein
MFYRWIFDLRFTKFSKSYLRQPNPTRNNKNGCP